MIDRLDPSLVEPPERPSPLPSPLPLALEYQPPHPRLRGGRADMTWGVIISILIANGVGWVLFGWLMMARYRDDEAGPVAVGAAFIVLGGLLGASVVWSRRQQERQPRLP